MRKVIESLLKEMIGAICMYIGVNYFLEPKRNERVLKREYIKLKCLSEQPCDGWLYGWEYLRPDIRDRNCYITKQIVSGTVVGYIKEKFGTILHEIEEKELKMP
ncbi:MAG: hypothetical protein IJV06_00745 [Bacteroidaceae bacterium]|nr:hypothetical protein [Bacteroidaceae bacterium]